MESDFVEKMEQRRALREERRRQEQARAVTEAKNAAAGSKAEQDRAARLALAKRSVRREAVVAPRFDPALAKIPFLPPGEDGEVNQAEAWWNSTLKGAVDPTALDKTMWKEGDGTPREETKQLISKYKGKPVPAGYRGFWDDIPDPDRLDRDVDRTTEKFLKGMKVHKYDTEEEKRKKQKAYDAMSVAEQRKFDRAASAASKKSEQDDADQEAAHDAEEEARLDRLEQASYEEVMEEFRQYEKLKLGRTNECEGTSRARPSPSQDPSAAFKWVERLRAMPRTLKHSEAENRAKAAMRFADMTEFLTADEAAEVLELGVIDPLMDVWAESNDDTNRNNVWGWLQATKEGPPSKQERHTHIISISFCRAMRNTTCAILENFNLQPVEGRQQPGTIAYNWLKHPATFLEILMTQPGVFDLLCRHLWHPSDECKQHAAHAIKNLVHHDVAFKQMVLDAKAIADTAEKPVLETLRLLLESTNFDVQGAAAELLCSLVHNDAARAQVLRHRGFRGVSVLPTVGRLMKDGSEHSQSLAARMIWDLCVKCRRDWNAQAQAANVKKKSLTATKRSKGRKTTIEEASEMLGDGSMVDYVKQDICRGADTQTISTSSALFQLAFCRLSCFFCPRPSLSARTRFSSNTQTHDTRETEPGLIAGLTHLLLHGAPAARVTR